MTVTLLEVEDLGFAYQHPHWVLEGVHLRLAEGDRVALLGQNGAGKSTLLHILMGLLAPCCGTLRWRGTTLPANAEAQRLLRRSVGLVLQDPDDQLFAETVEADVIFGPLNAGLPRDEAEARGRRALAGMEITPLATRRISSLSLGEKKKVALAGVLAMEPEVLLLDEPTAGLDHHGATALMAALQAKNEAGVAILIATHSADLALEWAQRALVLDEGQILANGVPAEIFANPTLCQRAGLRRPAVCEIATRLMARLTPEDARSSTPSSVEELVHWLEILTKRSGATR